MLDMLRLQETKLLAGATILKKKVRCTRSHTTQARPANLLFKRCLPGHQETKLLAEATFLKKQMYYNMRIKTMHRNARNVNRIASEGKKV